MGAFVFVASTKAVPEVGQESVFTTFIKIAELSMILKQENKQHIGGVA